MALAVTIAKLAPELTLNSVGEASGLRVMVCNNAPATAKLAPNAIATKARGKRKSTTVILANSSPLGKKAFSASNGEISIG